MRRRRSAPLSLGLFGEDEGSELADAPLPALDALLAWPTESWPAPPPAVAGASGAERAAPPALALASPNARSSGEGAWLEEAADGSNGPAVPAPGGWDWEAGPDVWDADDGAWQQEAAGGSGEPAATTSVEQETMSGVLELGEAALLQEAAGGDAVHAATAPAEQAASPGVRDSAEGWLQEAAGSGGAPADPAPAGWEREASPGVRSSGEAAWLQEAAGSGAVLAATALAEREASPGIEESAWLHEAAAVDGAHAVHAPAGWEASAGVQDAGEGAWLQEAAGVGAPTAPAPAGWEWEAGPSAWDTGEATWSQQAAGGGGGPAASDPRVATVELHPPSPEPGTSAAADAHGPLLNVGLSYGGVGGRAGWPIGDCSAAVSDEGFPPGSDRRVRVGTAMECNGAGSEPESGAQTSIIAEANGHAWPAGAPAASSGEHSEPCGCREGAGSDIGGLCGPAAPLATCSPGSHAAARARLLQARSLKP